MLGFVSNYLFYYFIYIDASVSKYVFIFPLFRGDKRGN